MSKWLMIAVILALGYFLGVKFPGPANNLGL